MTSLRISKEIYDEKSLSGAVEAYKGFAEIKIEDIGESWTVSFEKCINGEQITVKEFENYLIGIENI